VGSIQLDPVAQRREIEAAIAREEQLLRQVVLLIQQGVAFARWPNELLEALCAALFTSGNPGEERKAATLSQHLFRSPTPALPLPSRAEIDSAQRRLAERLRADLPGLTRLGAGLRCGQSPDEAGASDH